MSNSVIYGSNSMNGLSSIHNCIPIFMVDRNGNNIPYPTNDCQRRVSDIVRIDNNAAIDELAEVLEWAEVDIPIWSNDYRYFFDRVKNKVYCVYVRTMKIKRACSADEELVRSRIDAK
jgi:hypothetical protein